MPRFVRLFACALTASVLAAAPRVASAQHVVTVAEASKLTLDSLTAKPRPIPRAQPHAFVLRRVVAERTVHRHPSRVSHLLHASRLKHSSGGSHARLHHSRT